MEIASSSYAPKKEQEESKPTTQAGDTYNGQTAEQTSNFPSHKNSARFYAHLDDTAEYYHLSENKILNITLEIHAMQWQKLLGLPERFSWMTTQKSSYGSWQALFIVFLLLISGRSNDFSPFYYLIPWTSCFVLLSTMLLLAKRVSLRLGRGSLSW